VIEADEEKQFEGNVYILQSNPGAEAAARGTADGVNLKIVGKTSLCEAAGEVLDGKTCEAPGSDRGVRRNTAVAVHFVQAVVLGWRAGGA